LIHFLTRNLIFADALRTGSYASLRTTSLYRSRPTHQMSFGPEHSRYNTQCGVSGSLFVHTTSRDRASTTMNHSWSISTTSSSAGTSDVYWPPAPSYNRSTGGVCSPCSVHATSTHGATAPGVSLAKLRELSCPSTGD
jgi:hypothetical protein